MAARGRPVTTNEQLVNLSDAALECHSVRHCWARMSSGAVKLRPTRIRRGRVEEAEREMPCTAGCGVVRVETFEVTRDGRFIRLGKPHYKYTLPYLIKRGPGDVPVHHDEYAFAIVQRQYPDMLW